MTLSTDCLFSELQVVMLPRCRLQSFLLGFIIIQFFLLTVIIHLIHENAQLKKAVKALITPVVKKHRQTHASVSNATEVEVKVHEFSELNVTILLFNRLSNAPNQRTFEQQLAGVKRRYPSSPLIWNINKTASLGEALNVMIPRIKTKYFLFVEPDASLSDRPEEGIDSLWNALEQFPEIDFVGGSYLSGNKVRVVCHRFRLCRYTFSESYEYARSLDDVMICDGTSSSFMGRTDSVGKVSGRFDPKISDSLVIKEFFFRAKSSEVVVGTRPRVIFFNDQFTTLHERWKSGDITSELVPFAYKHKIFILKDDAGNIIDLCSSTSPLSGKGLCIEQNTHKLMIGGGHWAYNGLYAYPFILKYLEVGLSVVSDFFDRQNVSYWVEGGVSLGVVKMRSILPWEAGDIDIIVCGMTLDELYNLIKPLADDKGYVVKKYGNEAVFLFCTPRHVGSVSGGLVTIFPNSEKVLPKSEFIKMETNGIWVTYKRSLFKDLFEKYGKDYLVHKLFRSAETIECKIKGHNACLPDFKSILKGKAVI